MDAVITQRCLHCTTDISFQIAQAPHIDLTVKSFSQHRKPAQMSRPSPSGIFFADFYFYFDFDFDFGDKKI
jgi:hypothetical protein